MVNTIEKFLIKEQGIFTAAEAREAGIDNKKLQRSTSAGKLERVSRGLYMSTTAFEDEYFLAQYRCGKGVFSHETALYLHGLSDRTPLRLMLTIPTGFNSTLLKDKIHYKFFYSRPAIYELGITNIQSPYGHVIKVYDRERTLCDCLKKMAKLDKDLVLMAVRQYMGTQGNDYAKLLRYADLLKIRDLVRQYVEVLAK